MHPLDLKGESKNPPVELEGLVIVSYHNQIKLFRKKAKNHIDNGQTNPILCDWKYKISIVKNKISSSSFTHHPFLVSKFIIT